MNEDLKIIIKAVTDEAKKNIQGIKQELSGVSGSAKGASNGFGTAMKAIGKTAGIAIGAIAAIGAALVALGKKTLDYQKAQSKLNTAFQSVGSTAKQASESYQGLYRFLGNADTSVEAAGHLAKLTTNQKELAEWTKICQGVYATFGDSLKIEALTEAANETAKVGKVTGAFADALNWAGVSEDDFNAKLAATASYEEREALIRGTLNNLYGKAAEIYEKNNKELLAYNESQAKMEASMSAAGKAVVPLLTALNNLSAALFDALKPAIDVIVPAMATFVSWITKGIEAVMSLLGVVSGGAPTITAFSSIGTGIGSAASGADNLASGLNNAARAAEKVKRATMGFDELNVVGSSSSSGSDGTGTPGYMSPTVDASKFTIEVEETEKKTSGFAGKMKKVAAELKDVFAPTTEAWSDAFDTINESWNKAKDNFLAGSTNIKDGLKSLGSYVLGDFIPSLVNGFSTNLAPVISDSLGFAIKELGKNFRFLGELFEDITNDVIIPVLDLLKDITIDTWEAIGDVWKTKGKPFLDEWAKATEHVRDTTRKLYDETFKPIFNKILTVIRDVWESTLGPIYRKLVDAILEIGTCLLELYNKFIAPIVSWIVDKIVPHVKKVIDNIIEHTGNLIKAIGTILGGLIDAIKGIIQFITGVFTGDWEKAWEGIKNIFSGVWDAIVGNVKLAWTTIKRIFDPTAVKAFFGIVWETIKGRFSSVTDWFKNTFTKAWTAVKNVFSSGGKIFDGIKDGILNGLKAVINGLISGINKVIAVPFNGINNALKKIKDVNIMGAKPFNWMPTISVPQIPKLARGGIVDRATLTLIGEKGKEAVVPLENNTAWMDKLVDKLAARQSGPSKIVLMLDGKELGWANINSINNITRQTGALQLVMA